MEKDKRLQQRYDELLDAYIKGCDEYCKLVELILDYFRRDLSLDVIS